MSRRQGVVTAFVKRVDAELGRVQVEYSAIEDQLESAWAPIATPMSGKSRGQLFMPEVGDEVLVAFQDGQFDTPFVVGYLWNGEQVSPEKEADNRVIVTPGGHQLRFEDKSGNRRVILKSDGGHSITLEDKTPKKIEIKSTQHTVTLDDTAGASKIDIAAGPGGVVSISLKTTPPSISISTGTSTIDIGPSGMTVTSPGTLSVNCLTANVTASAMASVTAGLLSVNAGMTTFSGVVQCSALIANAITSPVYSPGIGNLI
jgi:phage baseplate assembly protein gpV